MLGLSTSIILLIAVAQPWLTPGFANNANVEACWRNTLNSVFSINAKKGKLVHSEKIETRIGYSSAENEIEFLGEGHGGSVFRITPKNRLNPPRVVKATDLDTALHDAVAMDLVRQAAKDQVEVKIATTHLRPVSKNVPRNLSVDALTEIQNVEGRSLFEILADARVPIEVKKKLTEKYENFIDLVSKNLSKQQGMHSVFNRAESRYFQAEIPTGATYSQTIKLMQHQPKMMISSISVGELFHGHEPMYQLIREVSGDRVNVWFEAEKEIKIFFKSDNFLVDKNYQIYLIDAN